MASRIQCRFSLEAKLGVNYFLQCELNNKKALSTWVLFWSWSNMVVTMVFENDCKRFCQINLSFSYLIWHYCFRNIGVQMFHCFFVLVMFDDCQAQITWAWGKQRHKIEMNSIHIVSDNAIYSPKCQWTHLIVSIQIHAFKKCVPKGKMNVTIYGIYK